jgi:hypothetical protein
MNLLEVIILHIFLVLFSMPSKPATGGEADTKRVETCEVEYGVEDIKYTRGLYLEKTVPVAEPAARVKVQTKGRAVVSRPVISSSKPQLNKRAPLLPKPPSIIIPK